MDRQPWKLSGMFLSAELSLTEKFELQYPKVSRKLKEARFCFDEADSTEDFQQVGLICRDALIEFSNSIYSPGFVPRDQEAPRQDDFVNKVRYTLNHVTRDERLRKLAKDLWDWAVRIQHDRSATRRDAEWCLLLTLLTTGKIAELVHEVLEKGRDDVIYKCPECGSLKLGTGWEPDIEGAFEIVVCLECGWPD